MKIFKKIVFILLLAFIIAQFFSPKKNEGKITSLVPFINETTPSKEVQQILETTCFDCHSNVTKYPWYNKITPVNYWLSEHVKDGKKHLNFSTWDNYSLKKKEHKIEKLHKAITKKWMPILPYTWTHKEAKLTKEQINKVATWAKNVQANYEQQLKGL